MRHFTDLNIRNPGDPETLTEMLGLASRLGYKSLALSSENPAPRDHVEEAKSLGVDLASRVDLNPRNPNELSKSLQRVRRRFEIVAVHCGSKAVARQAAKDHRVDILSFSPLSTGRSRLGLDRQGASLAAGSNCAYELRLSDILDSGGARPRALLNLKRDIWNATQEGVPVVFTSGAGTPLRMREPRALASIACLLGVSEERGLEAVSDAPRRILERNREKLGPGFVSPGVKEAR